MMWAKLFFLGIGTLATLIFFVMTLRGRKYDPWIEGVPNENYSDKELWAAGYALQEIPLFSLQSALGKKMMGQAVLLYPENEGRFAEFWARLYLARTLSLSLLVAAFVFCATAWMEGSMLWMTPLVGCVAVYLVYDSGANAMGKQLQRRSEECLMEFSNVVSKLSLLLSSGMILREAWRIVAYSGESDIYKLMKRSCQAMNDGKNDLDAIYEFGMLTNTPEIRKFTSILAQSASKGGSDITVFLAQQTQELWSHKRQLMLKKGDEAAAKLLIPTTLMLIGILMIIIVAAVAGLNLAL